MNYLVELKSAVKYNTRRTQSNNISIENFVTTDNVLQNKAGITLATNLPPQGSSMPGFEKNNILVANIRPYLKKIWFADRDGGCSADVLVFEVNKKYDPKFIILCFVMIFSTMLCVGQKERKCHEEIKIKFLTF